jgi:hypothetical protein
MSELATAAFILMGVWLGVLTLVIVLIVRQIGVLTVQLSAAGPSFSVDEDGPEVNSPVPAEVIATLPQVNSERATILFISATCTPCRTLVADLQKYRFDSQVTALVAGRQELADGLIKMLSPSVNVVRDPAASQVAEAFNIHSTPFALMVEEETVKMKTYVRSADHFLALVAGHRTKESETSGGTTHVNSNSSVSRPR